jgi:hypothetical protein
VGLPDNVNDVTTRVPPGEYALLCEMGYLSGKEGEGTECCRLTLISSRNTRHEILQADELLSPEYPLLTETYLVWRLF